MGPQLPRSSSSSVGAQSVSPPRLQRLKAEKFCLRSLGSGSQAQLDSEESSALGVEVTVALLTWDQAPGRLAQGSLASSELATVWEGVGPWSLWFFPLHQPLKREREKSR